jgi:hypothetical protein
MTEKQTQLVLAFFFGENSKYTRMRKSNDDYILNLNACCYNENFEANYHMGHSMSNKQK